MSERGHASFRILDLYVNEVMRKVKVPRWRGGGVKNRSNKKFFYYHYSKKMWKLRTKRLIPLPQIFLKNKFSPHLPPKIKYTGTILENLCNDL